MTADPNPTASFDSAPADRLVDEVMAFLRGGPIPDPFSDATGDDTASLPATASGPCAPDDPADFDADEDTITPPAEPMVGPYRVLRRVGRGGMGEVYKAQHASLDRVVALKTIRGGAGGRAARQRFRTEGAAVARLDHPNIVRIYEFGEDRGVPYYAMEWAGGGNLATRIGASGLPPGDAAKLVRDLAGAMSYAHGQHVLHRDLKPNNVVLTTDGVAKVADFGLARLLDDPASRLTADDAVLGTPSYMAPEQAAGRVAEIDTRTDVYALGAVLYECLTGAPPFTGASRHETMAKVRDETPAPPSSVRPDLPKDLETVCLRCLEKNRVDRYPSAAALAADLGHYLAGEPLDGRPWTRARKAARAVRKWGAELAIGLVVLAAGVGAVLALTPPPRVEPTAEERLSAARAALAAALDTGQGIVLVPESGPPPFGAPVRWGDKQTRVTTDPAGRFWVSSWATAWVELAPESRRDSYRVRAEVYHEQSDPLGGIVGVYTCGRSFPGPGGVENGWGLVTYFNDVHTAADAARVVGMLGRFPDAIGQPNTVSLSVQSRGDWVPGQPWEGVADRTGGAPFLPSGAKAGVWRRLAVEVTPRGISATFAGARVGELAGAAARDTITEWVTDARARAGAAPWETCPTDFSPRGGLGFVVRRGTAAFRNVVVESLDPTP